MSDDFAVMAALAAELDDMSGRLARLQDSPVIGACASLSGDALHQAMIALQDLDLLTQTAAGLAEFARALGEGAPARARSSAPVRSALDALTLHSLAERLEGRIGALLPAERLERRGCA